MSDMRIPWEKLNHKYTQENLEYKEKVRNLLTQRLGFEPDLRASIDAELNLRRSFKKYDEGLLSKEILDELIETMVGIVSRLTKDKGF